MARFAQDRVFRPDRGSIPCSEGGDGSQNDEGRPHPGRPSEDWCRRIDQMVCRRMPSDESPCFLPLPSSLKPATLCAASWKLLNCWSLCSTALRKLVQLPEKLCRNAVIRPATPCLAHA